MICTGIRPRDIPSFPCAWRRGEQIVVSVAEIACAGGTEFVTAIEQVNGVLEPWWLARMRGTAASVPAG